MEKITYVLYTACLTGRRFFTDFRPYSKHKSEARQPPAQTEREYVAEKEIYTHRGVLHCSLIQMVSFMEMIII